VEAVLMVVAPAQFHRHRVSPGMPGLPLLLFPRFFIVFLLFYLPHSLGFLGPLLRREKLGFGSTFSCMYLVLIPESFLIFFCFLWFQFVTDGKGEGLVSGLVIGHCGVRWMGLVEWLEWHG